MLRRSIVFPARGKVEVQEVNFQPRIKNDEVLIENTYSLISTGTELAYYDGKSQKIMAGEKKYPILPGYSSVGKVLSKGSLVNGIDEGDFVFHYLNHSSHHVCKQTLVTKISGDDLNGALFINMIAIALTGLILLERENSDKKNTVIVGLGILGILEAQLLKSFGYNVIGLTTSSLKKGILNSLDIDSIWFEENISKNQVLKKIEGVFGELPQIVVEATGISDKVNLSLEIAQPNGTVVLLGSPRSKIEIDVYDHLHVKGKRIVGAHTKQRPTEFRSMNFSNLSYVFQYCYDLLTSEIIRTEQLITHSFPAKYAIEAYEMLKNNHASMLGVKLEWK